jgi:hypothetical protein
LVCKVSVGLQERCQACIGVFQARFAVVRFHALTWSKTQMWKTMNTYVIMYNIIIESEREHSVYDPKPYYRQGPLATIDHQVPAVFAAFLAMRQ